MPASLRRRADYSDDGLKFVANKKAPLARGLFCDNADRERRLGSQPAAAGWRAYLRNPFNPLNLRLEEQEFLFAPMHEGLAGSVSTHLHATRFAALLLLAG